MNWSFHIRALAGGALEMMPRRQIGSWVVWGLILSNCLLVLRAEDEAEVTYKNYRDAKGPRSIHVVRVPRGGAAFQLLSVHANGQAVGLDPVSEQAAALKPARVPVAAINGDFYRREGPYAGDPRGLQIMDGELISAPAGSASFWVDAAGEPHASNTVSLLQVTWPNGSSNRFGLNGARRPSSIELYTPAVGASTHTAGGRELVLEPLTNSPWLLLRPNHVYRARVREAREKGDTRIPPGCMVLSIGPGLARALPPVGGGAELSLSTEIQPGLRGVKTAISGGPILVHEGKRQRIRVSDSDDDSESYKSSSMLERHPRSAIGWNREAYFLVEVDGRYRGSIGMTLNELSAFLLELGCEEALNLDGGGSSTLFFDGKVQNRPCDGAERPIANALVVVRAKRETVQTETGRAAGAHLNP